MKIVIIVFLFISVFTFSNFTSMDFVNGKKDDIIVSVKIEDKIFEKTLPFGSKMEDLLLLFNDYDFNLDVINVSQILHNNDYLNLPLKTAQQNQLISINYGTLDQLDQLPGIGKSYAQRIIDYRNQYGLFTKLEDLMLVKGIKEKLYVKLKDFIKL
ncbi:MAG: ComEA family DNA-binding protein [Erysipelotrichaceae bacterium]